MANKQATREKHKSKHVKEKSKKERKHEKHIKHKKHKKERKNRSDSSDSDNTKKEKIKKQLKREEWDFFDTILNRSNVTVKDGIKKNTRKPSSERLDQNIRELNPYWKDGGCGLPPNLPSDPSIAKILNQKLSGEERGSRNYIVSTNPGKSKLSFLKPGEDTNISVKANEFQGNWRKKTSNATHSKSEKRQCVEENKPLKNTSSTTKILTNEDLNILAAKLMKAEIMGDTAMVNKLKAELEAAKKVRESCEQIKEKNTEVVIIEKGMKKSYEGKQNYSGSKRQKINTHDIQGRKCYFPDDNKYSLKNLFEREKTGMEEQFSIPASKLADKNPEELFDIYLEAAASNKVQEKIEERQYQKTIKNATAKHKALEGCKFCIDNKSRMKHLIISTGKNCYLSLPEEESLVPNHCLIVPLLHEISMLHLDENVWSEIKTYQRVLTKMFLEQDKGVIFFENARSFKYYPHCFIQCIPLEKEIGDLAPIYFQKAIGESETEWSSNKKVIDFRNKDLRRCIPKGLPYFAVSFGTEGGFAHVIEDEYLFKRNFAEEVIGGMMDLDHKKWRKSQSENFRNQRQKALEFLKIWKKYEFNENTSSAASSDSE